jgi:hypothetical protein
LREGFELLSMHGSLAHLGGGRQAVKVVAFGAEALGELAGLALLFEPVVNDLSPDGLPMLETVGGPVEAGLVEGDLLVEPSDGGSDLAFPPLLGIGLPLYPHPGFS